MAVVPEYRELKTTDVKPQAYNPKRRTERRNMRKLLDSLAKAGRPDYPILVTSKYVIIDGHRRHACALLLGWDVIPAIVLTNIEASEADLKYASINATHRRHTENELLTVWPVRSTAVDPKIARKFEAMEKWIGRSMVNKLADAGLSTSIYRVSRELGRYVEDDVPRFTKQAITLLLKYPIVGKIREAMKAGVDADVLRTAVETCEDFDL